MLNSNPFLRESAAVENNPEPLCSARALLKSIQFKNIKQLLGVKHTERRGHQLSGVRQGTPEITLEKSPSHRGSGTWNNLDNKQFGGQITTKEHRVMVYGISNSGTVGLGLAREWLKALTAKSAIWSLSPGTYKVEEEK